MKTKMLLGAFAGALVLSACVTGDGYGADGPPRTQLAQCTRNALIGAGVGAVIGATQGPSENRAENVAIGAAVGGVATYGVCSWLTARAQQRVEDAYYEALTSGEATTQRWEDQELNVSTPQRAPGHDSDCRQVRATISDPEHGVQQLPPETFCRTGDGRWVPA